MVEDVALAAGKAAEVGDEGREGRRVLRLAWPIIAERFSLGLMTAIDGVLVGRYVGDDALAGVGIASLLFWVGASGILGIETGATAAIAWDYGAGRADRLRASLRAAIGMAFAWGLGAAILTIVVGSLVLNLLGLEPESRREGTTFLRWAAAGLVGLALFHAGAGSLRAIGNARLPMLILLLVNVLNAGITWLLISGVAGVELGVAASGIGYGAAALTGGVVTLAVLTRGYGALRWSPAASWPIAGESVRRILRVGVPVTLEEIQFTLAFLAYGAVVASLGTAATAAHTIALRMVDLAIIPGFGLGTAATALVGQAMGAGRPDRAASVARAAATLGLAFMVVAGIGVVAAAPQIAAIFTDDPDVVDEATSALRVFALGFPALALFGTLAGSLRGAGDVRVVLVILTCTAWGVRVPGAFAGAHLLGLGLTGAWLGATVEVNTRAALVIARYLSGKWKLQRV